MKALFLLITLISTTCFATGKETEEALTFLSPCMKQAASVMGTGETISLESGKYVQGADFRFNFLIYRTGMEGYQLLYRLNVIGKHNSDPMQDGPDFDLTCELVKVETN